MYLKIRVAVAEMDLKNYCRISPTPKLTGLFTGFEVGQADGSIAVSVNSLGVLLRPIAFIPVESANPISI